MRRNTTLLCILFIIAANLFSTAKAQVNTIDSLALVDLYHSTNGPNWIDHTNWLTTKPVSTWYGIAITANRVVGVYLSDNNLKGTLRTSIGNLTALTYLSFGNNNLSGTIPASLGNLINLNYLYLYNNQLTGTIPASLGKLINLTHLYLYNNQLTGAIPASLGNLTALNYLYLEYNQFTSTIPATLGNLINLNNLYLNNNQLTGAIPASLGKLINLINLDLNNNQLSGTIPAMLGKLINLTYLNLYNNQLTAFQYADSATNTNPGLNGYIYNNLFTFDGLQVIARNLHHVYYGLQDTILPIHQHGNILSVSAGGTLSNNTYTWYNAGKVAIIAITGDSTFTPWQSGMYYVAVTNRIATQLTLHSETIYFSMNNLTVNKSIAPTASNARFSVYPNPASNLIHIQTTGTATITLTNSNGKVLLTKSINNSDVINVSKYANGTYYLTNKTTGETQKIIIAH